MIQFFKGLPYHIKGAFKSVARHFAMSISAASAVTVTLVLMSCFLLLATNLSNFTNNLENSVKIHVKLSSFVETQEQIDNISSSINSVAGIKAVEYSSKDEEMDAFLEYIKSTGGTPSFYEQYQGENNPLRNAYIVEVVDAEAIEQCANEILQIEGVESAEFGGASTQTMISAFASIQKGGAIFIIALSCLAIFLISNTIKMTIYARRDEISIMRNVGAANWFIKTPFMIEGMIIGAMGSLIPILFTIFGYNYIYSLLGGVFFSDMFPLYVVFPYTFQLSLMLLLMGMGVGFIGSFFSVNKHLRWKR